MDNLAGGLIRQHHSKLAFIYRISDALLILAALRLAAWSHGLPWTGPYLLTGVLGVLLFYILAETLQLYRSWRGVRAALMVRHTLLVWFLTAFGLLLIGYATKSTGSFSRLVLGFWLVGAPGLLLVWRLGLHHTLSQLRARGHNSRRTAIAGTTTQGERLARRILATPALGLRLTGFFDDRDRGEGAFLQSLPVPRPGRFGDLIATARNGGLDVVYIALPMQEQEQISRLISALSDTCASVYLVPDFFTFDLAQSRWVSLGDIPTISVFETPFFGIEGWLKRLEDLVVATLALALLGLPMLLIALGVRWTSPGPALFRQRRYGLDGRPIRVWKFRTMKVCEDGDRVVQARRNDGRVTPFGAFLRRTSLDELPQLFNVLAGGMSIVGPRPHAVAHNEEYRKRISGYMLRHKVKPGITGWAQVNGLRGPTDTLDKMEQRVEHDLWYIRSWSLGLDFRIMFRTLRNGFMGENAY
jgi:putative colanic acid biosynthesis UDP-glucose lipid carrier transferase